MTKPALLTVVLASTLAVACSGDDGATGTQTDSETGSGSGDETETGDAACTPAGVYGDCGSAGLDACMAAGPSQCLLDDPNAPSIAVCGRPCADVCDCWAAPADGDAPVACRPLVTGDDGTCVLDCSAGQACPSAMSCNDALGICVFGVD